MDYGYLHLDWRELANRLSREQAMDEAFRRLLELADGDVEAALQAFERQETAGARASASTARSSSATCATAS